MKNPKFTSFFWKKEPEKEKDELHKEFGIFNNCLYITRKMRKYKPELVWLIALSAVTGAVSQYLWSFVGKFIIDIIEVGMGSEDKDFRPLVILLLISAIIAVTSALLSTYSENRIWFKMVYVRMKLIGERLAQSMSMNYEALEDPKMLDRQQKANNATNSNNAGTEGLMHLIQEFLKQILLIFATVSVLSTLNLWLVLIIAVLLLLQFASYTATTKKDKIEVWDKLAPVWRKIYYMQNVTQDFSYAKDIRLFGMKNWLSKKQQEVHSEKYGRMKTSTSFWSKHNLRSSLISVVRNVITYGFLIYSVLYKDLTVGSFTLYVATAATFSSSMTNLLQKLGDLKRRSMEVDDFRSFIEIKDIGSDFPTVDIPKTDRYTFTFENVSFKYRGQENYAVKNLNLTLSAGEKLAVVGLNGAGKTTFIKLLLRLYDVSEGRILLNGIDIRSFNRTEYYKLFAPVFQTVEIFAFPMSENVSMRSPAETDCDLSEDCLRRAGMGEKLDSLMGGVHTELLKVIHDDGIDLSGGEKQKLALARALYKDSPIVVLDEPTAALDALAEYKLYMDFDSLTKNKSAVYISHRLSSTRFCDHVAMFKEGEMIEYGTHEELLRKGGAYSEMFEIQAQYYKDEEVAIDV